MSTMIQSRNDHRQGSTAVMNNGHPINGQFYGHVAPHQYQFQPHGNFYAQAPSTQAPAAHSGSNNLASAFANLSNHGIGAFGNKAVADGGSSINTQGNGSVCYQLPDGRWIIPALTSPLASHQQAVGPYSLAPPQGQFLQANHSGSQGLPSTPRGHAWISSQQVPENVPELVPRRSSLSSNEEPGPGTPFYGAHSQSYQPNVAVFESPLSYNTPSPQQNGQCHRPLQLWKLTNGQYGEVDLTAVMQKDPAVPIPIPAIHSGERGQGTLESSLENRLNTTNVYIRGLHPNTTDAMLHNYGARFGEIVSAKSMMDQQTDMCKGFGFVKYHNFIDGENCIRGFFHIGYEAKWARESHNSRLKTLGDPENTNLYVSNLPFSMNDFELGAVFEGFQVKSMKVLRDENGMSRGVGFARFETPEICNEIIEKFHGKPIGDQGTPLQIRFADTKDQKDLKARTHERRQFKTNEYNTVVFGGASPYPYLSPTSTSFSSPLQNRVANPSAMWAGQSPISPTFINISGATNGLPPQAMASLGGRTQVENVVPLGRYTSRIKIEGPRTMADTKQGPMVTKLNEITTPKNIGTSMSGADSPIGKDDTAVELANAMQQVTIDSSKVSPTKSAR